MAREGFLRRSGSSWDLHGKESGMQRSGKDCSTVRKRGPETGVSLGSRKGSRPACLGVRSGTEGGLAMKWEREAGSTHVGCHALGLRLCGLAVAAPAGWVPSGRCWHGVLPGTPRPTTWHRLAVPVPELLGSACALNLRPSGVFEREHGSFTTCYMCGSGAVPCHQILCSKMLDCSH